MRPVEVVIPVKSFTTAKTRLAPLPRRAELSRAMFCDTLAAVAEIAQRVVLVSDEPSLADLTGAISCPVEIVADPGRGLNAAVRAGDQHLGTVPPGTVRIAMVADLPVLRPVDLVDVVTVLGDRPYGVVVDADGTGTTMLVSSGPALTPHFGVDSARRHRVSGAVALPTGERARHDVDTPEALDRASRIGVGRHTLDVMSTTNWEARLG